MNLLRLITFRQQAAPGFDPDAQAFITAAGITDSTQQSAINTLVLDLKGYGIWTKMKAVYPFVGGTATTHKYNLIDPQDTDPAFRLDFQGGWTHSSTGALPNGSTGYANTFITPSSSLQLNSAHIGMYSRTNLQSGQGVDIGELINNQLMYLSLSYLIHGVISNLNNGGFGGTAGIVNTQGLFVSSRTANNLWSIYKNNSSLANRTTASAALSTSTMVLGKTGNDPVEHSAREFAFASIGDGLDATEVSNLYTAVQAFQTTLGRQV
jgi:hypothetical protein